MLQYASPPRESDGRRILKCDLCGFTSAPTLSPPERFGHTCGNKKKRRGPGTALRKFLQQLGIKPDKCGGECARVAREMDQLGVEGVKANKQKYIDHLKAAYSKLSLLDRATIAAKLPVSVAAGMAWNGAAEWLVDEAIGTSSD